MNPFELFGDPGAARKQREARSAAKVPIVNKMFWWLSGRRPFYIGEEYKIELSELDHKHGTAKIIITNLKTQEVTEEAV